MTQYILYLTAILVAVYYIEKYSRKAKADIAKFNKAKSNKDNSIRIIIYTDDLKEPIKTLNYEWLEKYFRVEKGDEKSLSNPKEYIIDKGGFIFYATLNDKIVGTASLLKYSDTVFELGKMAVTESAQGFGIGKLLLEHCIESAKTKGIQKLVLYSNTKLDSAIHLYRSHGFVEIHLEDGLYERANIKMEKLL